MKYLATSPVFYFFISACVLLLLVKSKSAFFQRYGVIKRILLVFTFTSCVISYLLLTGFGANLAVKLYSFNADNFICNNKHAVLLPSGLNDLPRHEKDYSQLKESTFKRTHAAIEWLKKDDERTLIISGDGAGSIYTEAQLIFHYIGEFDIEKNRLFYEDQSTSTHLSAINVAKLIGGDVLPTETISLITSQLHMRRAMGTFKKSGLEPCPIISDYQFQQTYGFLRFFPSGSATHKSQSLLHEVVGSLWYYWTDRL